MFYERKIRYLSHLKNGDKTGTVGFVKIEASGEKCNLQFCINGLYATDTWEREIWIGNEKEEKLLAPISIEGGRGTLVLKEISLEEISYATWCRVQIPINKERRIFCQWKEEIQRAEAETAAPETVVHGAVIQETVVPEITVPETAVHGAVIQETVVPEVAVPETLVPEAAVPETVVSEAAIPETVVSETVGTMPKRTETTEEQRTTEESKITEPPRLWDEKWKQLMSIYPHIQPFSDSREYLSVTPADFVVLHRNYYKLVGNSFLLHGYYNYEHLILSRVVRKGEEIFYIGVPGNFYDREKRVAIMFGFESFECQEEPASSGDYGYYMIRVEL